eukprot:1293335-Amphidinium_carterae.2
MGRSGANTASLLESRRHRHTTDAVHNRALAEASHSVLPVQDRVGVACTRVLLQEQQDCWQDWLPRKVAATICSRRVCAPKFIY